MATDDDDADDDDDDADVMMFTWCPQPRVRSCERSNTAHSNCAVKHGCTGCNCPMPQGPKPGQGGAPHTPTTLFPHKTEEGLPCVGEHAQPHRQRAEASKARQSKAQAKINAKQSKADQRKARQRKAKNSKATQSKGKQRKAEQGNAKQGRAEQGKAKHSKAKQSNAQQSRAKNGKSKHREARQSTARQSKGIPHAHHGTRFLSLEPKWLRVVVCLLLYLFLFWAR